MQTVIARIRGRVQGVFFRAWTTEQAERRGLSGWVRNRTDGSVEALFHGPGDMVKDMLDACHRGPPAAAVDEVAVENADEAPETSGFHQRATA